MMVSGDFEHLVILQPQAARFTSACAPRLQGASATVKSIEFIARISRLQ